MNKAIKKMTALGLAAVTAAAVGVSASAATNQTDVNLVKEYRWECSKKTTQGMPSTAGHSNDSCYMYYTPNGYEANLLGANNTIGGKNGYVTISTASSYASSDTLQLEDINSPKVIEVSVFDAVTDGIRFLFVAYNDTVGNTYTANGTIKTIKYN